MNNIIENPILRTYNSFKQNFGQETYLSSVKESNYRTAIARLRCSSHTLAIERGRYTRPKTPVEQRICYECNVLEDELHFVTNCKINEVERFDLDLKVRRFNPNYIHLNNSEKFVYLMSNKNSTILTWLGKFLYKSFKVRSEYLMSLTLRYNLIPNSSIYLFELKCL